jgi:hypothetical protein
MMEQGTKERVRKRVEITLQKLDTLSRQRVKGMEPEDATAIKEALKNKLKAVFEHLDFLVASPEEKAKRQKITFSFDAADAEDSSEEAEG